MRKLAIVICLLCLTSAAQAQTVQGFWVTAKRDASVLIYDCGNSLCGKIVWLKQPNDPKTGKAWIGANGKPILGQPISGEMIKTSRRQWAGQVYDVRNDGAAYDGSLTLQGDSALKIEGCYMYIFCESEILKRIPHVAAN
jgi:uncharacterized protein (DUF2147 family)